MNAYLQDISPDVAVLSLVGLVAVLVIALLGRRLSVSVGNVHAELTPNGGSSMRDAVNRIETTLRAHGDRLAKLEQVPPPSATAIVVNPPTEQPG